jgi:hypothetical protein
MSLADTFIERTESSLKKTISLLRRGMSYLSPKDDWIEGLKRRLAVLLNPFFEPLGRPLVFHCHDEDYMYTVGKGSDAVERALYPTYQRNFASTRKYRYVDMHGNRIPKGEEDAVGGAEKQWSDGSWVLDPDDTDWQHHVYLFDNGDLGHEKCDVYGHKEVSAEKDPSGHVSGRQENGDPDENVVPLLANAGITRTK